MSRSYKHHPFYKPGSGTEWKRFAKNQANRQVRRSKDVPNGKVYRKFFCSWDINDYIHFTPKRIYTGKEVPNWWHKYNYRK